MHQELAHREDDRVAVARRRDHDRGSRLPLSGHRARLDARVLDDFEERQPVVHDCIAVAGLDPDVHPAATEKRRRRDRALGRAGNVQRGRLGGPKERR